MQSPLTFDHPWLLLLLPVCFLAFWATARRSFAGLPRPTQMLALTVRCLLTTLLVFALAGAHLVQHSDKLTTLFLLDVSQSVSRDQQTQGRDYVDQALASKPAGDEAGVIEFGRTAALDHAPSENLQQWDAGQASVAGDATDLAAALRLAQASFPVGLGRKIVVLSDGNENIGSAADEIAALRAGGVRVDVGGTALEQERAGGVNAEVLVENVALPASAPINAPFVARAVVSSTVAQKATLIWQRDGKTIQEQKVDLKAGKSAFALPQKVGQAGLHRIDVVLKPSRDSVVENNQGFGLIQVQGRPRVLYVADKPNPALAGLKASLALSGIDLVAQAPGQVPASVPVLAAYDAIMLSDVPANELSSAQMTAIGAAVRDFGVGLGMVGGLNSFGAGHYAGTPIEAALPVNMEAPKETVPPVAVVVVLDASGSMAQTEDGIEKVRLAGRAAVQMMSVLKPGDQVAVTAVRETTSVTVPLSDVTQAGQASAAVEMLSAGGGGIYCYQGLVDAYAILQKSRAPIKHVIIVPDTADSEQKQGCLALARQMSLGQHITTSVCGIGRDDDPDVPFQKALASAGSGQSFVVGQAGDLTSLFQRDVISIQQPLFIEQPTLPQKGPNDEALIGLPLGAEPPLLGYNLTTLKPQATLGLVSPSDRSPILATWQYGLGRSFAFTGDNQPHWAADWLSWPEYARFWTQTLRWTLRSNTHADFQAVTDNREGRGHLVVDAFTQSGGFANRAALTAQVVGPDLASRPISLAQTAPGRYEGTFATDQIGAYLVSARSGTAHQTADLVVPYSPEYRTLGPNLPLLTRLTDQTGGKVGERSEAVFHDAPLWIVGILDLSPTLLLLSALLFVGDVAIRRLMLRPPQLPTFVGVAEPVAAPQLERLLTRRAQVKAAEEDDPFPYVASLKSRPGADHKREE